MMYVIEVSFSTKRVSSVDTMLKQLDALSSRYNAIEQYHITESKSQKYNLETIYVYCCKFDTSDIQHQQHQQHQQYQQHHSDIDKYVKAIKNTRHCYIDMIRDDTIRSRILYVSPYYLKSMNSNEKTAYLTNQRQRSYSETDVQILRHLESEVTKYNKEFSVESLIREPTSFTSLNNNASVMSYEEYLEITKK